MTDADAEHHGTERGLFSLVGPGLVTGASDDDPSGIATYSQVGAQFGYAMLWPLLFTYPLMFGIQQTSAVIGRVTGRGIAGNLVRHYSRPVALVFVLMLVVANVINLGADIGAMGAAVALVFGGPILVYAAVLAVVSLALQVLVPYHRYVGFLKWLTLALLAYVATVFMAGVDWPKALRSTVLPSIRLDRSYITGLVALLGTTISPYLFFWQASEEVEEVHAHKADRPLRKAPDQAPYQLRLIRVDTALGMGVSSLVAYCIIVAVAATLNARGVTDIETSAQAAQALRPVAGQLAFVVFSLGIVGTGLLAVPILAGSAAYAIGEAFGWRVGLERRFVQARNFYIVLGAAILIGLGLNLANVNPIKALYWAAVINGVMAGPIMVMTMLMSCRDDVMGGFCLGPRQRVLGWAAALTMVAAGLAQIASMTFWGK